MSRTPTPRPAQEHHAALSRIFRQVSVDAAMPASRREALRDHLTAAMRLLEQDLGERPAAPAPNGKRRKRTT